MKYDVIVCFDLGIDESLYQFYYCHPFGVMNEKYSVCAAYKRIKLGWPHQQHGRLFLRASRNLAKETQPAKEQR
jgi:hypothetical protein